MGGVCSMNRRDGKCVQNLVGKPEWKIPVGTPKHRSECNIRIGLIEIEWKNVGLIHVAEGRGQRRDFEHTLGFEIKGGDRLDYCERLLGSEGSCSRELVPVVFSLTDLRSSFEISMNSRSPAYGSASLPIARKNNLN